MFILFGNVVDFGFEKRGKSGKSGWEVAVEGSNVRNRICRMTGSI